MLLRNRFECGVAWRGSGLAFLAFLLWVLPSLSCLDLVAVGSDSTTRPNVVVILADDLGYNDVSMHGSEEIPTPNIDALAASGVRFTSGYSSHPFCSPMRAGFMTGRYQHRLGYVTNVAYDPQNPRIGLPTTVTTIAQRLKDAGYVTGMAGKWHLGASHLHHPQKRGFDEFYGFLGGGHDYFSVDTRIAFGEGYRQPLERNGDPKGLEKYLTDALTDHAVEFIESHQDRPYFYFLAYNAPHGPLQAPEESIARFAGIEDPKRRTYAAMVHQLDVGVGRVLSALEATGQRDRTLVFFLSDNGGPTFANGSNNDPLRGNKGEVYEGGIRVPFVASWPAGLPQGVTYDHPVISFDISCTALAVAGAERLPEDDGVNLVPYLKGERDGMPHQSLYFRKDDGNEWSVRSGRWKLVAKEYGAARELYDVEADIGESKDLFDVHRSVAEELTGGYSVWNSRNAQPLFPGYREYHERKNEFYGQLEFEPSAPPPARR